MTADRNKTDTWVPISPGLVGRIAAWAVPTMHSSLCQWCVVCRSVRSLTVSLYRVLSRQRENGFIAHAVSAHSGAKLVSALCAQKAKCTKQDCKPQCSFRDFKCVRESSFQAMYQFVLKESESCVPDISHSHRLGHHAREWGGGGAGGKRVFYYGYWSLHLWRNVLLLSYLAEFY